ncbi:hypothetical protein D3C71_2200700 [compost metagenome]
MEAQRHEHRDQVHRGDDEQIFPQQLGAPYAGDQRLNQEDQPGAGQPRAEDD